MAYKIFIPTEYKDGLSYRGMGRCKDRILRLLELRALPRR